MSEIRSGWSGFHSRQSCVAIASLMETSNHLRDGVDRKHFTARDIEYLPAFIHYDVERQRVTPINPPESKQTVLLPSAFGTNACSGSRTSMRNSAPLSNRGPMVLDHGKPSRDCLDIP